MKVKKTMDNLLEKKKYNSFVIEDVFDVFTGASIPVKDLLAGDIPRITASEFDNGITHFTKHLEHKNFRTFENFISISFLGQVFYQKGIVSLDMKIHGIKPKNKNLNSNIALFLIPLIEKMTKKYSYGYQLSSNILKKQKIMLPVNSLNEPDWKFMNSFVEELKKETKPKNNFILHDILDDRDLEEVEWDSFFISDLFTVQRGKRITKENQIKGDIPYVSSTSFNNGVDNFIGNKEGVRMFDNCLTIANSGSVGEVFYHPYKFVASDHVTHIKRRGLNKYHYIFLINVLRKIGDKYSFNREISDTRLRREKIVLPVNNLGEPDWDFMEQYVKRVKNELHNNSS